MTELVRVTELTRYFDLGGHQGKGKRVHAVDKVSFAIGEREIVGLVGESGSGKSTLGKTMLGLHDKTSGTVSYRGETLPAHYSAKDFQRFARKMQMIFQDPYSSLNPRMTVGEIIAEGLLLHGLASTSAARDKAAHWLERVGLHADHMSRYPHEFSGGQRQRIGIARALALNPSFIAADEAVSALDVSVAAQNINLLQDLQEQFGLTYLFITHDLGMVEHIADRIGVMYLGSLVEIGPVNDVYFNPLHPYTQILIASNPEPDPATERARLSTPITGEIPSPVNVPEGCRFASRCPQVMDVCRQKTPTLQPVQTEGRLVACHLY